MQLHYFNLQNPIKSLQVTLFLVGLFYWQGVFAGGPCSNPDSPTTLTSSHISCAGATTAWTPGAGTNNNYYFDLSTDNFTSSVIGYPRFTASTTPEYVLTNLDPSTTYYFRVKGWESGGSGGCYSTNWSAISSFTTDEVLTETTLPVVLALDQENCFNKTLVSDPGTDPAIAYVASTSNISPINLSPNEGSGMLEFNSFFAPDGAEIRLELPVINTEGSNEILVRFDWLETNDLSASNDYVIVQTSTDGGANWTNKETVYRVGAADAWVSKNIAIGNVQSENLLVGLLFHSAFGVNCYVDHLSIVDNECAGTPTATTLNSSSATSCESLYLDAELSLGTPLSEAGYSYQWQQASAGSGNWSNIDGATMATYTAMLNDASKDFRLLATCDYSGLSDYSDAITIIYDCNCSPQTLYWYGSGSTYPGAGTGTDANNVNNWSTTNTALVAPSAIGICDNLIFSTVAGSVSLSDNFHVGSMDLSHSGNGNVFSFNAGSKKLIVTGNTSMNVTSGNMGTDLRFNPGTGTMNFRGDFTCGATTDYAVPFYSAGTGTIVYGGNLTFSTGSFIYSTSLPERIIFDGSGNQTITASGTGMNYMPILQIGGYSANTPTVILAGDYVNDIRPSDLEVHSTLRFPESAGVNDYGILRSTLGGSFWLGPNAKLELGGDNIGGSTAIGNNNFPQNFSTITLLGTVEYNGVSQTTYSVPTYNHLIMNASSDVALSAETNIDGDLTISQGSLVANNFNINLKGDYSNNALFVPGTNSVNFVGSELQLITGSGILNFYNVELNNSNGLSLVKSASISNGLTLTTGLFNIGSNNLTFGENGFTGGTPSANNMIVADGLGEVRKEFTGASSFVYAIGTAGASNEYTPVTLTFNSGTFTAGAYVGAKVSSAKNSALNSAVNSYIDRTWVVEPFNISGFNYDIRLDYVEADIVEGDYTVDEFLPVKISGGQWYQPDVIEATFTNAVKQGIHNPLAIGYMQWDGLTTFSEFGGAGGQNQPLPVELLSFSASCDSDETTVSWTTASEHNSSHFDLEKSTEGHTWRSIATINAAGNSTEELNYAYVDQFANVGDYYRINQVDIDGSNKVYGPIQLTCTKDESIVKSFPNPSSKQFSVVVNDTKLDGDGVIHITTLNGQLLHSIPVQFMDGINLFNINKELPSGIYLVEISSGKYKRNLRQVIQ